MQAVRLARYHTRRSHLVRFCGAYHGWWGDVQPGIGNPVPAHETYTLKDMSDRHAACFAHAARHRLRAGQPVAGTPSQRLGAEGFGAARQRPTGAFRQGRVRRLAERAARSLYRAQHRPHFRRGVCRLSCRARRRAGVFRRARRSRHLRQDARRRPADRRGVRAARTDEALSRRSPRRHLLRPRLVQFSPLRHGRDERVFAPPANSGRAGNLSRPRRHSGTRGRKRLNARCAPRTCRSRSPICRRSGRSATRGRRDTIGCFNIICGPKAWR